MGLYFDSVFLRKFTVFFLSNSVLKLMSSVHITRYQFFKHDLQCFFDYFNSNILVFNRQKQFLLSLELEIFISLQAFLYSRFGKNMMKFWKSAYCFEIIIGILFNMTKKQIFSLIIQLKWPIDLLIGSECLVLFFIVTINNQGNSEFCKF